MQLNQPKFPITLKPDMPQKQSPRSISPQFENLNNYKNTAPNQITERAQWNIDKSPPISRNVIQSNTRDERTSWNEENLLHKVNSQQNYDKNNSSREQMTGNYSSMNFQRNESKRLADSKTEGIVNKLKKMEQDKNKV